MANLETYIALLRGINVGGNRKLPMASLVELVAEAGGRQAKTYIQSGNVIFQAPAGEGEHVATRLTEAIAARFGYDVPVIVRTVSELEAVASRHPFFADDANLALLHVLFLADAPGPEAIASLDPDRSPPDVFEVRGREVYVHYRGGAGTSKLTNDYVERKLNTKSTARNWRTVQTLLEMAKA